MSVPHGAVEMFTAASRSVGLLPSQGLMFDSYDGERKVSSKSSYYIPVDSIIRRQELAAEYNSNWIDDAIDARSNRFTRLTGKQAVNLNTTIPSVLDHDEHWEWENVDEVSGKVSYLKGDFSPSIYDLVFQYLKLHQRDLHLLCYDNHVWRNGKGGWAGKFKDVGLDLVNGEIRVVNGARGYYGIVKGEAEENMGTASTLQSVSVRGDEALEDFLNGFNNRCSPLKLGHELKMDERLLQTVGEEKAVLRKEKKDKEAKRREEFKRKMRKMEGKQRDGKRKNKISQEKGYVGNLTGVVKLSRPQTRTFDNEMSWKVRNDYLIKKPNFVSPNHPTRSNWLREGRGEDEVKRIVDEQRINNLVERKGAMSLEEEENSLKAVRRESTFRMSRLRNGFQGGDVEKQG